jgi:thimet oligopeptidase
MTSESYLKTARIDLAHAQALRASLGKNPAETVEIANDIAIVLDRVMAQASLYQSVHPDLAVREASEVVEQEASRFATELSLDRGFFDAMAAVSTVGLDAETLRFVQHSLRDFRRSGVDKDEATRAQIKKLNEELVQVSQEFGRHLREDVRTLTLPSKDSLRGLPADYVAQHADPDKTEVTISTDYPDYVPFMTYADDAAARKALYTVYRQRGYPSNVTVMQALIEKRHALATILGYRHFADYVTETRMIENADKAQSFVDRVADLAAPHMKRDYDVLLQRKKQIQPGASEVFEWERGYLEEKVKTEQYGFSSQEVRPYFSYPKVKEGVLAVCARLFSVSFVRKTEAAWHASVETYDVEQEGQVIGRFMLDMHPRKDKYKHAAQFTYQSGIKDKQIPIGVLVCNFAEEAPALMEHKDVVTFFHEFGHLLHHLFGGQQRFARFSGVATEWDFVEAPSQMLEEWAWDEATLRSFAHHFETGEAISAALITKMRAAEEFAKGIQARVQMFYAALSLAFYSTDPKQLDTHATLRRLQARYSPFAYVPDTHFHLSFGHLDGYSAGYYTYMWSLVIAKDLLSKFEQNGLMDLDTARAYRDRVLGQGGAKDARALVEEFLGRPYSFEAFERWLARSAA